MPESDRAGQGSSYFRAYLRSLPDDIALAREAGLPVVLDVDAPLHPSIAALMDTLGVEVRVAVATPERRALAERAQQLRASGMLIQPIADELGVSRSYAAALAGEDPLGKKAAARKVSYAGVCVDCGGPTDGSNGPERASERCKRCAAIWQAEQKTWTREAIVDAIQRFAADNGRPPTAMEWQWADPEHGYPPTSACYGYAQRAGGRRYPRGFPTWANAIEAAGFARPYSGRRLPKGEGRAHNMARSYVVLHRNGDGGWHEHQAEAFNETTAIEQVASEPGEYVAVRLDVWRIRTVAPVTRMTVQAEVHPA